jgi:hypothetical protein
MRARRTRLRFAATWTTGGTEPEGTPRDGTRSGGPAPGGQRAPIFTKFVIEDGSLRTVHLRLATGSPAAVVTLCEDLALHDWLLTTVLSVLEGGDINSRPESVAVLRLRPVIGHLLPLWMPGARVEESLLSVWDAVERRPGFSRQWESLVAHIRDQMTLAVVTLLNVGTLRG